MPFPILIIFSRWGGYESGCVSAKNGQLSVDIADVVSTARTIQIGQPFGSNLFQTASGALVRIRGNTSP